MKTPDTFVTFRIVIASLTLFLLVLIGLGLGDVGPLHPFWTTTYHVVGWFEENTGVYLR